MPNSQDQRWIRNKAEVLRKFGENGKRLFLADDSESFKAEALAGLIEEENLGTALVIAPDVRIAGEFGKVLGELTGKTFEVFCDAAELLNGLGADAANYREKAKTLAQKHPFMVLGRRSGGKKSARNGDDMLLAEICKGKDFNFRYHFDNRQEFSNILLADLLAEAGYGLLAVDDVYSCFSFEDARKAGKPTPLTAVRIDFGGQEYYSRGEGYRKLKLLCDGSQRVLLLSGRIMDGDVVSLYAALDLISGRFPFYEARRLIGRLCGDADGVYEDVFNDIINSQNDSNIVNSCFHEANEYGQAVPTSVEMMDRYINKCVEYASQEEIVLRALYGFINRYARGVAGIDVVLDQLESNDLQMARCICTALFGDEIKGKLENVRAVRAYDLDAEGVKSIREIFLSNGGVTVGGAAYNLPAVERIYSDDSVYEFITRGGEAESGERKTDGYEAVFTFCAPRKKAIAVKKFAEGESGVKLVRPVLVLTYDPARTEEALLGEFTDGLGGAGITVEEYGEFVSSPVRRQAGSAVLFDAPSNPDVYRKTICRLSECGTPAYALVCGDMDGMLFDAWNPVLEKLSRSLPVGNYETMQEDGHAADYLKIYADLDKCVRGLSGAATGTLSDGGVKELSGSLADVIQKYVNEVPVKSAIARDVGFLAGVSTGLSRAFANSVTVGGGGELTAGDPPKSAKKEPVILFNSCALMLTRKCNFEQNDCYGCGRRVPANDYLRFLSGVVKFYDDAQRYAESADSDRDDGSAIIKSRDDSSGNAYLELGAKLAADKEEITDIVLSSLEPARRKNFFVADYGCVHKIRALMAEDYRMIFDKYYSQIKAVFGATTEKLYNYIEVLCSNN